MKNIKACLSHNSDEWATPKELYNAFMKNGCYDPCPLGCKENCLETMIYNSSIYINPPFSKLKEFTNWVLELVKHNNVVYLLMPCRTDTKYFKNYMIMV